jgi:uncharacterized protein (TIGR03435 family)
MPQRFRSLARSPIPAPLLPCLFAAFTVLPGGFCPSPARAQDPPAAPEFEAAAIKPQAPSVPLQLGMTGPPPDDLRQTLADGALSAMLDSRPAGWIPMDQALVGIKRWPLASIVAAAYRTPQDRIVGPSWMTEARFNIDAKIPDGAPAAGVNEMLQSLLRDRFGLKAHMEDREFQGYALTVGRDGPKLTRATSESATPSQTTPDKDDSRRAIGRLMAAMATLRADVPAGGQGNTRGMQHPMPNSDAADIARQISQFLRKPVVDMTGLDGKYDLELEILQGPSDSPESAASRAISKFGLKLEPRKVSAQVVVVDSVSRIPTEN